MTIDILLFAWYVGVGTGAALSSWAFLLRYHLKSRGAWRHSLTGVALMTMAISTALIFTFVDVNLWFRILGWNADYPGRVYIGPVLFTMLAVAITLVWVAFEKAQKPKR